MIKRFLKIMLIGVIFSLFGFFADGINIEAVSGTKVYADNVLIKAGESAEIPVLMKNNCGIMAYMLTAEYDSEKIEIEKISAGKLSQNGVFDHNLTIHKKNKFDVLWSCTKEIKEDGVLFYLQIRAKKDIGKKKTVIKFTYSNEDTFNEKYENVELKCTPIKIQGNNRTVIVSDKRSEGIDSNDDRQQSSETQTPAVQTDSKKQEGEKRTESREMERETVNGGSIGEESIAEDKMANKNRDVDNEVSEKTNKASPEVISGQSINIDETIRTRNQNQAIEEKSQVISRTNLHRIIAVVLGVLVIIVFIVFVVKRRGK